MKKEAKNDRVNRFLKRGSFLAIGLAVCLGAAIPLNAVQFDLMDGKIQGAFDTKLSMGVGMRLNKRDMSNIGVGNGGTYPSLNEDDGNLNYNQFDLYSEAIKSNHELELSYEGFTAFCRASALYDFAVMGNSVNRTNLGEEAKARVGRDLSLLDLFAAYEGNCKNTPYSITVGSHVLNIGESTFIQNGLNVINPVDVSKLRTAGAELRDALTPVSMASFDVGVSDRFNFGGFYQFEWKQTRIDPKGTFFSDNDFVSPDSTYAMTSSTGVGDDTQTCTDVICAGGGGPIGQSARRGSDKNGKSRDNYGIFLKYYEPMLNDSEFGLYAIKYTSRLPVISGFKGQPIGALGAAAYFPNSYYFVEYPDSIDMIGGSFNTMIGKIALQGEYSFKNGVPIQLDDAEILAAVLGGTSQLGTFANDSLVPGYKRKNVSQYQVTATKVFGPCCQASSSALVFEVGATKIHSMEAKDVLRYEASGTPLGMGFPDSFSWGYRVLAKADFLNAIKSVALFPSLAFSHDVNGTSPKPISNFIEGRQQLTLALAATERNKDAKLSYTKFFGAGKRNSMRDRDFLTFSVGVSF